MCYGTTQKPAELYKDVAAALAAYEIDPESGKQKIQWVDRWTNLYDLARQLRLFEKDNEQKKTDL